MNDVIFEAVVTTVAADGKPHVAPMGVRYRGERIVLMPFRPSTTYDNIRATGCAVLNVVTDTRVFAGCVTGRRDWPTAARREDRGRTSGRCAEPCGVEGLAEQSDDAQRPVLIMVRVHEVVHSSFAGFNRAQAAVIEGAVLVSRLHMLPPQKVDSEWPTCRSPSTRRPAPRNMKPGAGWSTR